MVQDVNRVPNVVALGSLIVVDDNVIGVLEGTTSDKDEGSKRVVALEVDAVDVFETLAGGKLDVDGRGNNDVRKRTENVRYLDGCGCSGHANEIGPGSRMGDHVHTNAALAGALAVEHPEHNGSDGEDHDDFNRYGEGADERTQGTMDEITNNQFVHTYIQCMGERRVARRGTLYQLPSHG